MSLDRLKKKNKKKTQEDRAKEQGVCHSRESLTTFLYNKSPVLINQLPAVSPGKRRPLLPPRRHSSTVFFANEKVCDDFVFHSILPRVEQP